MNCGQCEHKRHTDGGHCYMFRTQPNGMYCAQFKPTDTVRVRLDMVKLLNRHAPKAKSVIQEFTK